MDKKSILRLTASVLSGCLLVSSFVGCGGTGTTPGNEEDGEYYTVTLNYNDNGSRDRHIEVEKEATMQKAPAEPKTKGQKFDGWYTAVTGGEKITFPYTPTADVTLYARWKADLFNVTFDYNYDGAPNAIVVEKDYNTEVEAETVIREGYTFRYWMNGPDKTIASKVEFPQTVTKNVTYYARWRDNTAPMYEVTFKWNFSGAPADAKVSFDSDDVYMTRSSLPTVINRNGFDFVGWSDKENGTKDDIVFSASKNYEVTGNCFLYAVWEQAKPKVNFQYNYPDAPNGGLFQQDRYEGDQQATEPETAPTREDHTFLGWYTLEEGGVPVVFPFTLTGLYNYVYAHWQYKSVTTDRFQAEYTPIDPDEKYPGYSGEATGRGIIVGADVTGVDVDEYPINSQRVNPRRGYYISYQYMPDATLTFEIYASQAISNATLKASLAVEMWSSIDCSPEYWTISVNGTALDYTPFTVTGANEKSAGDLFKCGFKVYTIGNINLVEGKNVIQIIVTNEIGMGGTTTAASPLIDYIEVSYTGGTGLLSWYPIYDNLNGK